MDFTKILEWMKKNRKKVIIGYLILCVLYLILALVWPRNPQYAELFSVKKYVLYFITMIFGGLSVIGLIPNENEKKPALNEQYNLGARVSDRISKIWEKHKHFIAIAVILLSVGFVTFYLYRNTVRPAMQSTQEIMLMKESDEYLTLPKGTTEIRQIYNSTEDKLAGFGVKFIFLKEELEEKGIIPGNMQVLVFDRGNGEVLCEADVSMDTVISGEYRGLLLAVPQTDAKDRSFEIVLNLPKEAAGYTIQVGATHRGTHPGNHLLADGTELETSLALRGYTSYNTFIRTYFYILMSVTAVFAVVLYWMLFIKRCGIETIFLTTVLVLGTIYGFLILPYMVPDEEYHIDMSYRYANILMNEPSTEDYYCLKRVDDAERVLTSAPSIANYRYVYENLLKTVDDGSMVKVEASGNTGAYLFMHFPAVFGIIAARVLHLGAVPLLFLGRWMNLLAFALMVWFGMKKLPFGKVTLFLISILPITLQQINSFSYDAVTLGFAFLYTCYILYLTYAEEPIKIKDMVLTCLLGIALIYCKQGAYSPFVFVFLLIPLRKFAGGRAYWCSMLGLAGAFITTFINKNLAVVAGAAASGITPAGEELAKAAGEAVEYVPMYSLGYFLQNPKILFDVLTNTVIERMEFYVQSMVGQQLGWVQIMLSNLIVIAFAVLIVLSVFRVRGEKQYITIAHKWWITFVCAASFGLVIMGMLVSWTPITSTYAEGVQGRYFLPFLFIFVFIGRNSKIVYDKNMDRGLMMGGCAVQLISLLYLMKAVF